MNKFISKEECSNAVKYIIKKMNDCLDTFTYKYPSPASINNIYQQSDNVGWTTSFWTGMLWLAYEYTGDEKYKNIAEIQIKDFKNRLLNSIDLENHDIGFLYSLSCVAGYKLTGDEFAKETALLAADKLYSRYFNNTGVIHCWGPLQDGMEFARIIIDCLMNLPLLYWATEVTGDKKYAEAAYNHAINTKKYIIRPNKSTYHSYIFNVRTHQPDHGETVQGYADTSCWSRGQAWGIYGFLLSYRYTKDASFIDASKQLLDYYLEHLPEDMIPYWDLYFQSGNEERDTSAAAITACGIAELLKILPEADPDYERYKNALSDMLSSLINKYTTKNIPESNGILLHGVYGKPQNNGVDECLIWGDYYYFEVLMRIISDRHLYW